MQASHYFRKKHANNKFLILNFQVLQFHLKRRFNFKVMRTYLQKLADSFSEYSLFSVFNNIDLKDCLLWDTGIALLSETPLSTSSFLKNKSKTKTYREFVSI